MSYLIPLWLYTLIHAWEDGDLSEYEDPDLERIMEWQGEPGKLVGALRNCGKRVNGKVGPGFLEGSAVHDWKEIAKNLIGYRLGYRKRNEKRAAKAPAPAARSHELSPEAVETWNVFAKDNELPLVSGRQFSPVAIDADKLFAILETACKQPFLFGHSERGWKMSLDWLLEPANTAKVVAMAYGNGTAPKASPEPAPLKDSKNVRERQRALAGKP